MPTFFIFLLLVSMVALCCFSFLNSKLSPDKSLRAVRTYDVFNGHDNSQLKALTWNMAAINNNPFEYWITNEVRK